MLSNDDRARHIAAQLSLLPQNRKMGNGKATMICCPFHRDSSPSMRVYYRSGIAECFACKQKWTFDDVALATGLEPFVRDPMKPLKSSVVMTNLPEPDDNPLEIFDRSALEDYRSAPLPRNKVWRGIPTNLLIACGCKLMIHKEWGVKSIYMPCLINGELRGYTNARMEKAEGKPSYIHAKGPWSKLDGLFPYDFALRMMKKGGTRKMVVVEGQRDALRLLMNHIPAMCMFGTNSWTDNKSMLLNAGGVDHLVPMMDGDEAGIGATTVVVESASKFMEVSPVRLWRATGNPWPKYEAAEKAGNEALAAKIKKTLWDPGNCPQEILDKLKRTHFTQSELA